MSPPGWVHIGGGIHLYRGHLIAGTRGAWWVQRAVRVRERIVTGPATGPYPTQAAARAGIDLGGGGGT